jgi:two-component system alkaline phosphatase synthesis response regulator PhoP
MPAILVVDDEENIRDLARAYLEAEGFTVHTAASGTEGLAACRRLHPDLVVLDVMLPGLDGLEVLQQIRRESEVYVMLLTARSEEADRVIGLTVGADDYLTKPFSPRELVARVKAILRRERSVEQSQAGAALAFRHLRIDFDAHRVWKDDREIELTPIEFELLYALARHRGLVLSREQLLEQVWDYAYYGDERVVDVHIGRIRKKIEDDPTTPTLIVTVRSAGYRFEDEEV